jgi:hypothetical protein
MQEGNDGPIVPPEKETLQGIMWDDPKLLKLIEKKKYVKAIEGYSSPSELLAENSDVNR